MTPTVDLPRLRRRILAWHRRHGLRAPWRESGDPYHALVAAVMAQQTQMSRVLPAYERFLSRFPSVERLAESAPADALRAWDGLGYNLRALRLREAARAVVERGGFPRDAGSLAALPGVGPFTAAVIASFAFGAPVPAIDTNVRRVLTRVFGEPDATPSRVAELAAMALARSDPARWNQALMDLGALVCRPRPRCEACPAEALCASREAPPPRAPATRGQPPYRRGAKRWYRGAIVRVLRAADAPMDATALARALGEPRTDGVFAEALAALARDGLVARDGAGYRLP
ncbi:MAG TPA: A/G-specific adenine glycosylase [Dehalococcoidia bacterium]|nr:A/G-specific adenine glycosylase [Dehalococcoidia bacterium]